MTGSFWIDVPPSRRHWFAQATRHAAWCAWWTVFGTPADATRASATWRSAAPVFSLGVASGEPRPHSVVLWTRLAPHPLTPDGGMPNHGVSVQWEMAEDEGFARVVQRGQAVAAPHRAHSVHVQVHGLRSGRTYFYRFIAAGQRSPTGRTRTAPDPWAQTQRLRMVLSSCQHYEMGHFTAHRHIAQADVDLVLFVGDYIYLYDIRGPYRVRRHPISMPDEPQLADFRQQHASYRLDPHLQAAHAMHPWLLMWDDQEVRNDYDGWDDPKQELDTPQFMALRRRAFQSYFEHLPLSPEKQPGNWGMPMLSQYDWGQLARLWLLDTRQYRNAPACHQWPHALAKRRVLWQCDAMNQPAHSMLGAPQHAWLANGLRRTPPAWQFVTQTTQVSASSLPTPVGPLVYADGWDAYPGSRQQLLQALGQPGIGHTVCLGGDVHRHVAAHLRLVADDRHSPVVSTELVTSSVTSKGLGEWITARLRAGHPDIVHCRSDERGYTLLDVSPRELQCTFMATPHPVGPSSTFRAQARYVLEHGQHQLHRG